jgi:hypothetical protein
MAAFPASQSFAAPAGLVCAPNLAASVMVLWQSLKAALFDHYRPELHYMRGPGPKWREKHAGGAARTRTAV